MEKELMESLGNIPCGFIARECICCAGRELSKSPAILMPFVANRVFGHEPMEIKPEWGLRDLSPPPPRMAYTLCNSLQCRECGALFLDYRFSDAQMTALYSGYRDEHYTRQRTRYEPGYAARSVDLDVKEEARITQAEQWLAPYLPEQPAILDWGGANGINSPFFDRCRFLHIYDISKVEVVNGTAVDLQQTRESKYDLVSCMQLLEHAPFPLDTLHELLPAIGPETLLYLEVPYETLMREHPGNLQLAPLKHHWHEHVNFFTPLALKRLVERAGLRIIADYSNGLQGILAKR
jgi:hypothetical protein